MPSNYAFKRRLVRNIFDRSGASPCCAFWRSLRGFCRAGSRCSNQSPRPTAAVTWLPGSTGSCHRNGSSRSFGILPRKKRNRPSPCLGSIYRLLRSVPKRCASFDSGEWRSYLDHYLAGGVRPLHHSAPYRLREQPAYRVIKREYERLVPVLRTQIKL